jgi:hypothetical protein
MSGLFDGLGPNGKLMVIGVTFDPLEVKPVCFGRSVRGRDRFEVRRAVNLIAASFGLF